MRWWRSTSKITSLGKSAHGCAQRENGKVHEMPCYHELEAYLDAYIAKARIVGDDKGALFRLTIRKTNKLGPGRMSRKEV
jgi:hypothetical protein